MFNASQFQSTDFHTSEEKAKFANHLVKFVESGFRESLFHNWFYQLLSNTFGHIAHNDRQGFYENWFHSMEDKLCFVERISSWQACGDPKFTFSDVEQALRQYFEQNGWVDRMRNDMGIARPKVTYKEFKVVAISGNANSFGLHGYVLMARDGECWEVGRSIHTPHPIKMELGDVVEVKCIDGSPQFQMLNCEIPKQRSFAPSRMIQSVWDETALSA